MAKKKKTFNETSPWVWWRKSENDWNLYLNKAYIKRRNEEEISFKRVENTCNGSDCVSDNVCWFRN